MHFISKYCRTIHVKIHLDGSLSVADDGRGIPVDEHPEMKRSTLEVVLTMSGAGAKFDKRTYKTSAGLHGMGAKAVTALSEWVEAEVRRNGRVYIQEYERGKPITEVREVGPSGNLTAFVRFRAGDGSVVSSVADSIEFDAAKPAIRAIRRVAGPEISPGGQRRYSIMVSARDKGSGVGRVQLRTSRGGAITSVPYTGSKPFEFATAQRHVSVRVVDRAGNVGVWRTLQLHS